MSAKHIEYCQFHPLAPASYFCHQCERFSCQICSNEGKETEHKAVQCFSCQQPLESQGAAFTATPFWRRLESAFKYPLHKNSLIAISISIALSFLAFLMPLLIIVSTAFILKYCFTCLEKTAEGDMQAIDFTSAYSGGLRLMGQLLLLIIFAIASVLLSAHFIGPVIASVLGIFMLMAIPASIMLLAIEDDLAVAINPLSQLKLMTSIGPAYLFLQLILIIMMSSTEAVLFFIDESFLTTRLILSSIASSYYLIVMFHIMGYVIFQYQRELGFVADEDNHQKKYRNDEQLAQAKISVLVKNGDYEQALKCFEETIKQHANNYKLADDYFKLLVALPDKQALFSYVDKYLIKLFQQEEDFKIRNVLKQTLIKYPDYTPQNGEIRIQSAELLESIGDAKLAATMLKDFHKDVQHKPSIVSAYQLMAKVLAHFPGTEKQQASYLKFASNTQAEIPKAPDHTRKLY